MGKMRWELKGSGDIDCMYDAVRLMNERDFFDGCVRDYLIIFRWVILVYVCGFLFVDK